MIGDERDVRIASLLQEDSRYSIIEIAAAVGMSPSSCHRRIRLLEEAGVIAGYQARLSPAALGFTIEFFVEVTLVSQGERALDAFEKAVQLVPEILKCHLMAGSTDYMLRVVASDVTDYQRIHRERLSKLPNVARLVSNLAIRTVRPWRGYPVRMMRPK